MSAISLSPATIRLRVLRRFAVLGLMLTYLLAGALHGICDLDVAYAPSHKPEIVSLLDQAGHPDQTGMADQHCHGCFSVTVAQSEIVATCAALMQAPNWPRPIADVGLLFDTDSPPPKYLA